MEYVQPHENLTVCLLLAHLPVEGPQTRKRPTQAVPPPTLGGHPHPYCPSAAPPWGPTSASRLDSKWLGRCTRRAANQQMSDSKETEEVAHVISPPELLEKATTLWESHPQGPR